MSIEESATRAKQGGKGRDIFVILVVSTIAAVLLLGGIVALWVTDNRRTAPAEADFATETPDGPVLQQDDPNPATDEPLP